MAISSSYELHRRWHKTRIIAYINTQMRLFAASAGQCEGGAVTWNNRSFLALVVPSRTRRPCRRSRGLHTAPPERPSSPQSITSGIDSWAFLDGDHDVMRYKTQSNQTDQDGRCIPWRIAPLNLTDVLRGSALGWDLLPGCCVWPASNDISCSQDGRRHPG